MRRGDALQTIQRGETLADAARKMEEHRVSALPVVDENRRVVGIVSERDVARKSEQECETESLKTLQAPLVFLSRDTSAEDLSRLAQGFSQVGRTRVEEVMTKDVIKVDEEDPVETLLQQMDEREVNHIPVVRGENLTGIVARQDIVSGLANLSRQKPDLL
ncbi:CBS domain-containing protein [Desulfonatronospira sp.]|uniref:CBS domain-containing protein n=1 Tax=Desulfonatronospira sp. TaxID=1962951 RepID=UPI0025BC5ED2|nr:CBS domain-containing protein [Desulfonatronospira sp.]